MILYTGLAAALFDSPAPRTVISFASAQRGEGVTYVIAAWLAALLRSGKSVAVLDGSLRPLPFAVCRRRTTEHPAGVPSWVRRLTQNQNRSSNSSPACIDCYDCVLLDCGSIGGVRRTVAASPLSDGIVIVAEAGRVSRKHIDRAGQVVRQAGGTLLGIVLNKRRYPIPAWLYKSSNEVYMMRTFLLFTPFSSLRRRLRTTSQRPDSPSAMRVTSLQPNDVIELQYRYTPEYNQTVSIQPDGFVTLQLLGDLKISGLTLTRRTPRYSSVRQHG